MKILILHGALAEEFGEHWHLDVRNFAEALRAVEANRPGFFTHLLDSSKNGVGYRVVLDNDRVLTEAELAHPIGREVMHLVPVTAGAGGKGIFGILLGAVLVAAAVPTGGMSLGALSSLSWFGANGALALGGSTLLAKIAFSIGTNLILSGVASMLSGTPEAPVTNTSSAGGAERQSYYFNGPVQIGAQGSAVPVGYGELLVGSIPVSGGLAAENVDAADSGSDTEVQQQSEESAVFTVPVDEPHIVVAATYEEYVSNVSVAYVSSGDLLIEVESNPAEGQYTQDGHGSYSFASGGYDVTIKFNKVVSF